MSSSGALGAPTPPADVTNNPPLATNAGTREGSRRKNSAPQLTRTLERLGWRSDTALAVATVAVLGVMILPLPPIALDLFLALSVSLSLLIFLFSLHIEKPLEFSAFPSVLLLATLMRLALNVASTRLILLRGAEGADAAGKVIQSFGQFVVGGNMVVGIIVFLILVVINFVVITKGAGRIAEVGARFTLDAMPGKQMAIDADLAAGLINEREAIYRRREIEHEADFFGSMDGASKFVRGDAIAGLVITFVNIMGGLIVGVAQHQMPVSAAASTYTLLTVGDGLVSQVPALLTSIAAGLVTTRAAAGGALGTTVRRQLFGSRRPAVLAAVVLGLLALVPGMPHFAFLVLAAALAGVAAAARTGPESDEEPAETLSPQDPALQQAEVTSALPVEILELELGFELVPMVDGDHEGGLLRRIAGIRKQLAEELGIIVPPVHMRDNLRRRPGDYAVLLSGAEIATGELRSGRLLAMLPGGGEIPVPGEPTIEPAFGLPARWILPADRERAELNSCTVVDPTTVISTHLGELLRTYAHEILGRRELQELLDLHAQTNPRLVEELVPNLLSLGQTLKVMRNLLRERVSIRDLRTILESLADHAEESKDPDQLTELVRQSLAKQLTGAHKAADGAVHALVLAPHLDATFRRLQSPGAGQGLDPKELQRVLDAFEETARAVAQNADIPVVLVAADIRRTVAVFVNRHVPGMDVLSYRELDSRTTVQTIGVIGAEAQLPEGVERHAGA
jgi:flagellar biosynthesis protein FlhA